jgi:bifunctional non-homologous end joining protein LigD
LLEQLNNLATESSPFSAPLPCEYARNARNARNARYVRYVQPELTGDVEYRSLTVHRTTGERRLRHPSFRGLRSGLTPEDLDPRS